MSSFQKLPNLSFSGSLKESFPRPSYYGNSEFILSLWYAESKCVPGIYQYNIENNQFKLLYKYEANFEPDAHGQIIDIKNNMFHIIGGVNSLFGSFNLITKKMHHATDFHDSEVNPITIFPSAISTNDYIYIYDSNRYFRLDLKDTYKSAISMQRVTEHLDYPKLLYIPIYNKIMILGSDGNDTIYEYNKIWNDWNQYSLQLPYCLDDERDYDIFLGFKQIIFIFYLCNECNNDIWCIDLMNTKLYKSNCKVPSYIHHKSEPGYTYALKDDNNYAHILNFETKYHAKISLFDVIPKELYASYRKHYEPLIIGFIKQNENDKLIPHIPYVIKQLILHYFPSFL